ncbi:MAG: DUF2095 family protein [Candidatus Bathyarchaeota archaeon]
MEIDKKKFKKLFPNLAKEIEGEQQRIAISSFRSDVKAAEKASSKRFADYTPDVVDFIRRCDSRQQAEEIIGYLEKRKEIRRDYAKRLRKQLREKGVRSFGPKKEDDYYSKHGIV